MAFPPFAHQGPAADGRKITAQLASQWNTKEFWDETDGPGACRRLHQHFALRTVACGEPEGARSGVVFHRRASGERLRGDQLRLRRHALPFLEPEEPRALRFQPGSIYA